MARRQDIIDSQSLQTLMLKHPYMQIFQKENWVDYLALLAQVYDLIEDTGQRVPFEGVKVLIYKFFREKELQSVEQKVSFYIVMCIEELKVLKDSHDQSGQRMLELTRAGKQLLQMVEGLLAQRVKYSGTGAETLLSSLNETLISQQFFDQKAAREHHLEKIKSYKQDLKRIEEMGPDHAQLLPVPHSVDALFAQAEGAAIDILAAVEDVKQAIELERKKLAQEYLDSGLSSGQRVNAIADFYEQLQLSNTHKSYVQAKNIFSHLEGYGYHFAHKNVPRILQSLADSERLSDDVIKRSQLNGFQKQFELADTAIQEKIRSQLELLQLQVRYSMASDIKGLQGLLKDILQVTFKFKENMVPFYDDNGISFESRSIAIGEAELFAFERQPEIDDRLIEEGFAEDETRKMIESLLLAEETTLKKIVLRFKRLLKEAGEIKLSDYPFEYGLAEYYVLSAIELFDQEIEKSEEDIIDLTLNLKKHSIVIRNVACFRYKYKENYVGLKSSQ